MKEVFENWLEKRSIKVFDVEYPIFHVEGLGKCMVVEPKEGVILEEDSFQILKDEDDLEIIDERSPDNLVFQFGEFFYYTSVEDDENGYTRFLPFEYVGEYSHNKIDFPMLGVHGSYEILSGSRTYDDWIKKAKFMGIKTLGICEKNTLSGVIEFQKKCKRAGIRPVIGESIMVTHGGGKYFIKLYCVNEIGWQNLLKIDQLINIDSKDNSISFNDVFDYSDGLMMVFDSDLPIKYVDHMVSAKKKCFDQIFFNVDLRQYDSDQIDENHLTVIQDYLNNKDCQFLPIIIPDAYYLEKDHWHIKKSMDEINSGSKKFSFSSHDHYFRGFDELVDPFIKLFDNDKGKELFTKANAGSRYLADRCLFNVDLSDIFIPRYEMTEEEVAKYGTIQKMFLQLVTKGFKEKILPKIESEEQKSEYIRRMKMELGVLIKGDFVDYFLILWSMIKFCDENKIMYALGRGSAAGCLISYLLGIVGVDPVRWGLLFSRFLNEARLPVYEMRDFYIVEKDGWKYKFKEGDYIKIGQEKGMAEISDVYNRYSSNIVKQSLKYYTRKTLPDIDSDFDSRRRDEVIKFLQSRMGEDRVCAIGTVQMIGLKGALKDLSRPKRIDFDVTNKISKSIENDSKTADQIDDKVGGISEFEKLIWTAYDSSFSYEFMKEHSQICSDIQLIMNQPKSMGQHPCGFVTVPKFDQLGNEITVYNVLPIRKDGDTLVSMWQGGEIEEVGLVKLDVLATKQLSKFDDIITLIEEETGERINITNLPLDDEGIYDLFKDGHNQDVFQFNGSGMIQFSKMLQPDSIEDLTAMNALFRPATLRLKLHTAYAKRKAGEEDFEYPWGCEEILKETYGIIVYQEQSMKVVQVVGGFSETEADDFRKVTAKKQKEKIGEFEGKFIDGAIKKGCPDDQAYELWNKLLQFASYSFNKSHALCYAMIGYYCQYFKKHYPVYFWRTALNWANDDGINDIIEEMEAINEVKIAPPSINLSHKDFVVANNTIYWSMNRIKYVGEVASELIFEEREKNGEFFSFKEFLKRVNLSKVNARVIGSLIMAGSFDDLCEIERPRDRYQIMEEYYTETKKKWTRHSEFKGKSDYFWSIKQKDISGIGTINFKEAIYSNEKTKHLLGNYIDAEEVQDPDIVDELVNVAGRIEEFEIKRSTNGVWAKIVLRNNINTISVNIWNDTYKNCADTLNEIGKESILIVQNGRVKYDQRYSKKNVIFSSKDTDVFVI
jgi:DNA polymerase III subunit alpha